MPPARLIAALDFLGLQLGKPVNVSLTTILVASVLLTSAAGAEIPSIADLHYADQATRGRFKDGQLYDREDEAKQDARRRAALLEVLVNRLDLTPDELVQAATILQHSNSDWPEEDGEVPKSQDNHIFAYFLARRAHFAGHKDGGWLMSVAIGRWLRIAHLPSEFGIKVKKEGGKAVVVPVSPDISDEQRQDLGIPFKLEHSLREPEI